jgi:hypothetical protein
MEQGICYSSGSRCRPAALDAPDEPAFVAALEALVAEHELPLVRFGRREAE